MTRFLLMMQVGLPTSNTAMHIFSVICTLAVVNVFKCEMAITNMEWDPQLGDSSSEVALLLSQELQTGLRTLLAPVPRDPASQIMVIINQFAPGSVRVKFTVGWLAESVVITAPGTYHQYLANKSAGPFSH